MKTATLTTLLFLAPLAFSQAAREDWDPGTDRLNLPHSLLIAHPDQVLRLDRQKRMPANMDKAKAELKAHLRELHLKLKLGTFALIQGSVPEWNNEVVKVVALFADGSRTVELANGKRARVKYANLTNLSPETTKCCDSHGVKICKEDKVYHPLPSSSIGIPEGRVKHIFENCAGVVRDGLDFVYDLKQVGKPTDCSPQKPSVCVGKMVYVEGYRNGENYEFEGPVAQVFTNGAVVVRTGLLLLPIDVSGVTAQIESLDKNIKQTAVVTSRDGQGKIPAYMLPEIEPANPDKNEEAIGRHGITIAPMESAQ